MYNNLNNGKFTKDEIIGIVFSKISPEKDWIFADIGSGTGKVAEFFSKYVKKVYAVEIDKNMAKYLKEKFTGTNVEVVNSHGFDFLKENEVDAVFFGGTKNIEKMLDVCRSKKIVVNCARVDVALNVVKKMKELGINGELILINVSKGYELANGIAFKSHNPVFMVVGNALRS